MRYFEKKSHSLYMPEPYTVSMIMAKSGNKVTTWNSSFFKQIPRNTKSLYQTDNSSESDDDSPI